jgi:uncharacterized protein YciI
MGHFIVRIKVKGTVEESDTAAQKAFLGALTKDKRLVLAGTLPETPGQGMAILRASTIDEARALYSNAPLLKRDLIDWTISELNVTFGLVALEAN